jgi:isocitrate/isopropylmalate dehydrogenase
MSKSFNLAVIPGDGIGTEVVGEGLKVLDAVAAKYGVTFNKTHYDLGAGYWHRTGEVLPDSVLAELAKADVILWALLAIHQCHQEFSSVDCCSSFASHLITTSTCDLQS